MSEQMTEMCGASNQSIDRGAACKYLAGHLAAGIPHTTANGFWWADEPPTPPTTDRAADGRDGGAR